MPKPAAQNGDTRSRLLEAATVHFARRGFEGARTQAIADDAGINKAMLYYHFQDKEHLYRETLASIFGSLFQQIFPVLLREDLPARNRLLSIVGIYQQYLLEHPDLRSLMLRELAAGGSHLKRVMGEQLEQIPGGGIERVFTQIQDMIDSGQIRPGDPRQIFLHIVSLIIFPFVARPLLETIWDVTPQEYTSLLGERIQAITDLLDQGLFIGKEDR
jgi:TetR/AcrR family transcriptional regulator